MIEECIEVGGLFCNFDVVDVVVVLVYLCFDFGVYFNEVICWYGYVFIDVEEEFELELEFELEEESWMGGFFYWVAIFVVLVVIVGLIGIVNFNLCEFLGRELFVFVEEE